MQRLTDAPARPPPLASRGFVQRCISYWGPVLCMSDGEFAETAGMDGLVSWDGRQWKALQASWVHGMTCFMGACRAAGRGMAPMVQQLARCAARSLLLSGLLHLPSVAPRSMAFATGQCLYTDDDAVLGARLPHPDPPGGAVLRHQ